MARTNSTSVQDILGQNYDTNRNLSLTPFIAAANALTNQLDAADTDSLADDDTLTTIETWLAAHFYSVEDPAYQSQSLGKTSGTYRGQTAMYLDSSLYGQMAKTLDPTGFLTKRDQELKSGGKKTIGFAWMGKPDSERLDYDDRN